MSQNQPARERIQKREIALRIFSYGIPLSMAS